MSFLASRTRSAPEGIGKPVRRREDPRLVSGAGCYTDDVNLPGQAYASMVRSPHAHARIVRIDAAAALASPGVLAVLTGADLVADGLKAMSPSAGAGESTDAATAGALRPSQSLGTCWIAPWLGRMDRHFDDVGFNEPARRRSRRTCWISFGSFRKQHRTARG